MDGSVNLLIFEKWFNNQIKVCFNTHVDIANKQDVSNNGKLPLSKSNSKLTANSLDISEEIREKKGQGLKSNNNNTKSSSMKLAEMLAL